MTIPSMLVLSFGAAVVAIAGFFIVHRVMKPINMDQHQNFLDAMLSIVGTLVSILLGLLVAAALDRYQALEQTVDTESACVAQLARISWGLGDTADAKKLRRLAGLYCDQVVNEEWPDMANGHMSETVFTTYARMLGVVVNMHPSTNGETNLQQALLTAVQQVGDCRRQRLLVLHNNWSAHLFPLLIFCAVTVLAFAYLYAKRGSIWHAVLICFVAVALGGNLGLVFLLSNPFSGEFQILPRGFELNSKLVKQVESRPDLQKILRNQE